ncbi:MAG TPA: beta-galactosidase [Armatimonadota bacterium]|nr:beta-galactosidase [Armatimonadota bacterium]
MQWDKYFLGSSYYPEQWEPARWNDDFRKMQHLGFNTVRMGEFAWAFFEPSAGQFNFAWMDEAIELAAQYGVSTVLCTPTASVPPWLRQAHRDVMGGNEKGPFDYGARKGYCTNSPAMLDAAERVVTAMAEHYGQNPHIIGWQLDNEPGYPFTCFDTNSLMAFQCWLKEKYQTVDKLNSAWGGAFWSHMYNDWSQIEFPANRPDGTWDPGQWLDYRRFFSDSFYSYLQRQAAILRQHIGDRFIFTNWPNTMWSVNVFQTAAGILDATAWDNYTATPGVSNFHDQFFACMNHDLARCAGPDQHFLLAEQSSQVPAHALPEGVRLQTYLDLAHGAGGNIFFEWRPPVSGAEQGYISVLQLDGSFGPAYEQHRKIGQELAHLGPILAGAKTEADVAMLFSYYNQWAQGFWCGANGYDAEFDRYYRGMKALQRNIDVIPPDRELGNYRVVIAPNFRMVTDDIAKKLASYVAGGGILVLNLQAGTRDEFDRLREMVSPGVFTKLAGITIPSHVSKDAMAGNLILGKIDQGIDDTLSITFDGTQQGYPPRTVLEGIQCTSAEVLATFVGGRMTGKPAATINSYGKGHVVYVGTDSLDIRFYEAVARAIADRFSIEPLLAVPRGMEIVTRKKDDNEYYFLLNLTEKEQHVSLPQPMQDMITANIYEGTVSVGPLDVLVFTPAQ